MTIDASRGDGEQRDATASCSHRGEPAISLGRAAETGAPQQMRRSAFAERGAIGLQRG